MQLLIPILLEYQLIRHVEWHNLPFRVSIASLSLSSASFGTEYCLKYCFLTSYISILAVSTTPVLSANKRFVRSRANKFWQYNKYSLKVDNLVER